ncbi:MAG: hypothetical protein DCC65_02260 [Planctomycetota bacterium]|nr:MAG: hypothetical protein DCC65_02260 [Planctomycetota bacterium]
MTRSNIDSYMPRGGLAPRMVGSPALPLILVCGLAVPACVVAPARADEGVAYRQIVEKHAPALVTIKFLLRMESQYGKRETESEITGLMIEPTGLVLCANSKLGAPRRFGSVTPTDIKILIGDDIEGIPAKVLARDTELDLAWVQAKEPPQKPFAHVDIKKGAVPEIGDDLYALRRMAKFFDRAPVVSDGKMSGHTKKPRELYVPSGVSVEAGQPIFTEDGTLIGIVVLQLPEDDEIEANPMAFMSMGRDIGGGLILPAAQVLKATERAKLATADEEEADAPASEPSDEDTEKSSDDGD